MEKLNDISVRYLKGVGPKRAVSFNKIGISNIDDLFYYFPRRYEDRRFFVPVGKLVEGKIQTLKVTILARQDGRSLRRRGFAIFETVVGDDSGQLSCVWFNQPYLKNYLKVGQELILYGKVDRFGGRLQMNSPEFEILSDEEDNFLDAGRITPVYTLPAGIGQRTFRKIMKQALDTYLSKVNDFLPFDLRSRNNLANLAKSILDMHFPEDFKAQEESYRRLVFEEFLLFQIPLLLRKIQRKNKEGIAHDTDGQLSKDFISVLNFELTESQKLVLEEIKKDMKSPQVMQRLLQGDVGSGKTVVAVIAGLFAISGGYQVAFMVPTEILARQHYEKIGLQLSALGPGRKGIKIGLLSGSLDKKDKDELCRKIKGGEIDLVIGTHALLEEAVGFKKLGLIVIDEQHKFGVGQRALLPQKGAHPDVLIMTATPIPRTLAITLYGDLDVSVINSLPPGRGAIKTLNFIQSDKEKAYEIVRSELSKGNQAYIVYPVIEESYALDIRGAKIMYQEFKAGEFKDFKIALIHGKLKNTEQDEIMRKFKNKEYDLLVSTTVLEVGIDIPAATCMVIQHAERFGLSQLHQLRGRVGRGRADSFCILISDSQTEEASARMEAMVKYNDGFHIAEQDLKIRGPGEFFGRRQHGLAELRLANPFTQLQILHHARQEAAKILETDPMLQSSKLLPLKERLKNRFPEYEKLSLIG